MSLLSEIKQRRITQIVVTYLAGGWIVTSFVDQVVDREVLPLVVYQVVFALYLFGILGALIIGWYHGEKGEQEAPPVEIAMLAVVALLALGTSVQIVRNAMTRATIEDSLQAAGLDLRRIGVLYFEDVSRDGSGQAVAEAITEGLIGALAEVNELEVTTRNAARAVQGLDLAPDSIASILDVGTVVDGTVDLVGDEIRVSVRLMEGRDGLVLSRETYTWPTDQVAQVSSELATELGNALREQLGMELRMREGQADAPNSAAWLELARAERLVREAKEAFGEGDLDAGEAALEAARQATIAAEEAGPDWATPLVLRAEIAYESWVLSESDEDFLGRLQQAVDEANAALAIDPNSAAALEWRGTARYRRFVSQLEDEETLDPVLESAREDLERAVRLDPDRASVNSTLSHLYYNVEEWSQAVISARNAYTQDAFLDVADQVVLRLFQASYDLGNYDDAQEWCEEGHERFPESWRFTECQIVLYTMAEATPDPTEAWRLFEETRELVPPGGQSELVIATLETMVGGVIGRAGLADSANATMLRARVNDSDLDPADEQMFLEAAMRSVSGDVDGALDRLGIYVARHPGHYPGNHWWWDNLQGNDTFERLQLIR